MFLRGMGASPTDTTLAIAEISLIAKVSAMNADIPRFKHLQPTTSKSQAFMRRLIVLSILLMVGATSRAQDPSITTPVAAPPLSATTPFRPMDRQERWQDYKQQNFGSSNAFFQTFFTGLGDFAGNVPHWDHGPAGFAEHQASEFARFTIGGTIHSSLAIALHQDTRYFPCACKDPLHRTVHAIGRTFFTHADNGHLTPDLSGLAGIYSGPMVMTTWYPSNYTALGYGVRQGNIAMGITAALYVVQEFTPDMKRALARRMPSKNHPKP